MNFAILGIPAKTNTHQTGLYDEFFFEGLMSRSETIVKCFFHMIRALNRSAGWVIIFVLEILIVIDRCISCSCQRPENRPSVFIVFSLWGGVGGGM